MEGRRHRGWSVPRRGCSCRVLVKASSERLPGSDRGPLDPGYISTLPKAKQGLITAGIAAGMLFLTLALNDLVVPVLRTVPTAQPASRLIGLIYLVTGITHFTNLDGFCDVYPERGAWGWWYLPGSAKFHVEWTGVAEVLGGIAVLFGDLPIMPDWVGPYGALGLLVLTIVVTPANVSPPQALFFTRFSPQFVKSWSLHPEKRQSASPDSFVRSHAS